MKGTKTCFKAEDETFATALTKSAMSAECGRNFLCVRRFKGAWVVCFAQPADDGRLRCTRLASWATQQDAERYAQTASADFLCPVRRVCRRPK